MATTKPKGRRATDAQRDQEEEDVPEAVRALREFAGTGEGRVQVNRKDFGDPEEQYLGVVPLQALAENPHELLRKRWGGGRYHLRCYDADNKYIKGGSLYFNIAGPPHPEPGAETEAERRINELEETFRKRHEAAAGGAGSPEIWLMLGQTLSELRAEIRRPQPSGVEGTNFAELAIGLLETTGAAVAPLVIKLLEKRDERPDPMEQMESMLRMAQMLKELSGQSAPTDGWGAIAHQLASPLGRLLNQHAENQATGAFPPALAAPGGGARPVTPNPPTDANGTAPPRPEWFQAMQRAIPQLVAWAAEGKDPELRAQLILEDLPEQYLDPIFQQLSRGDGFLTEFIDQVPHAAPHREWFRVFFASIYGTMRGWLEEEGEELEEAPPPVWELGEGEPPEGADVDAGGDG